MGLEGIVSKRKELSLPLGALAGLAQNEEPERAGSDTGGGRGLGQV